MSIPNMHDDDALSRLLRGLSPDNAGAMVPEVCIGYGFLLEENARSQTEGPLRQFKFGTPAGEGLPHF
jgi:hypothetical protein